MNEKTDDIRKFARGYLDGLCELITRLDEGEIAALILELQRAYDADRQIFIIGNGGSEIGRASCRERV